MPSSLALAFCIIVAGLLLLATEFVIPTGGVLFGISLACIVLGVAMTFMGGNDPIVGLITLVVVFVAVPSFLGLALKYWPRSRWGRRFFLMAPAVDDATVAAMPVHLELEQLRGRFGKALSSLRPSGVVDFDGKRIDTITEGSMVEEGSWVRCIEVKAGRVIVRPVDKPDLRDLENAFPYA